MLFFLLSGFCVHLPMAGRKKFEWKPYAARRFFRIYPPYLAAILLTLGCELLILWLGSDDHRSSINTIYRSIFMVQNYGSQSGQMAGNPSLWSLPVEMELYVVYPLFLWLLRKAGSTITYVGVAVVSVSPMLLGNVLPILKGGFFSYWLIWCAGAWLAERWKTGSLPKLGMLHLAIMLAAFAMGVVCNLHGFSYYWYACHFWAIGYGILLWFTISRPLLPALIPPRLLSLLVWMGSLSYSLYLIHFPVFRLAGEIWIKLLGGKPVNFLIPLIAAILVVPLAGWFYRLVEAPSHRLARHTGLQLKEIQHS